jgi:hypothetical protein
MSIMTAIAKGNEKKNDKTTVDYTTLTVSQKFDALGRLARATAKFTKPEFLVSRQGTDELGNDYVHLIWFDMVKGMPVINNETYEITETDAFKVAVFVKVRLYDMDLTVSVGAIDTDGNQVELTDKVQIALGIKYRREVFSTLSAIDLGPLTRTRSSKE